MTELAPFTLKFSLLEFLQISAGLGQNNALGAGPQSKEYVKEGATNWQRGSDVLDSNEEQIRIDKSNILLLGPTGSGNARNLSEILKIRLEDL